jgi:hypothetical protein
MPLRFMQLELPLFAPPSFDEILCRKNIRGLTVQCNKRMRATWRVTVNGLTKERLLIVPPLLANAPEQVKEALIDWARLPLKARGKRHAAVARSRKEIENFVWQFMLSRGVDPGARRPVDPARFASATHGACYDLDEVSRYVNETYFEGRVQTHIRWGTPASTTSYQAWRRDRAGNRLSFITIAGAYNHPDVPRFALEAVVYHEMLHAKLPVFKNRGRNVIHGADFKRAEKSFPHYQKWRRWEKAEMPRIVRSLRRAAAALKRKRRKKLWFF